MTPLLLDTHAFLWAVKDPARLSESVRRAITDIDNPVFVSAASAWELAIKHRGGKLPSAASLITNFDSRLISLDAQALVITPAHAIAAGQLDWEHRDPFDRLLAAQALAEELTLVTCDRALLNFSPLETLW